MTTEANGPAPTRYPTVTCVECRETVEAHFGDPSKTEMVERSLCFTCNFWQNYVVEDAKPGSRSVVIDGQHYAIGPETGRDFGFRGFGGRKFMIRFLNSGIEVTSTNLWHQGDVPPHFLDRFPNTAEFVKESR